MTHVLWMILISAAMASELVGGGPAGVPEKVKPLVLAEIELGNCVPKKGPQGEREELLTRAAAEKSDLPKEEILARLIFSETLSTGYWQGRCESPSVAAMMEGIGWGVIKRVHAKKKAHQDPYYEAIFAPKQFSTSFSSAKVNPFAAAFLCPLKSEDYLQKTKLKGSAAPIYQQAQKVAQKIIATYETTGLNPRYAKISNFFYPRSEYFGEMRPSWAPNAVPGKNKGYVNILNAASNPCIEFYQP